MEDLVRWGIYTGSYGPAIEKSTGNLVTGGKYSCTSMTISLRDINMSSNNVNHTEFSIYLNPDVVYETSEDYSAMQPSISADGSLPFFIFQVNMCLIVLIFNLCRAVKKY